MRTRLPIALALTGMLSLAHAFEPGSDRVCTPSADGQTFECRDKSTGATVESKMKPSKPVTVAPDPLVAPVPTEAPIAAEPTSAPKPAARNLPSYLMQNPSVAEPASDIKSAPVIVEQPARTRQPVREVQPVMADGSPAKAPPATPADASHGQVQQPTAEPAPMPTSHSTGTASASEHDIPRAIPETKPSVPSPAASRTEASGLPGASAFLALPASHYTLVLASERDPSALDGLINALEAQSGQLYLLKLGMPDGDWYSLCWSDFNDLDVARAARASLPADAPIRSGWPRRIGLLQKELAR